MVSKGNTEIGARSRRKKSQIIAVSATGTTSTTDPPCRAADRSARRSPNPSRLQLNARSASAKTSRATRPGVSSIPLCESAGCSAACPASAVVHARSCDRNPAVRSPVANESNVIPTPFRERSPSRGGEPSPPVQATSSAQMTTHGPARRLGIPTIIAVDRTRSGCSRRPAPAAPGGR